MKTIGFISLGCPKNLVDSEVMMGQLKQAGYQITANANDADTVVGAIGERGLLKHAAEDPSLLDAEIVDVMEPPFPAVSADDPVRDAIELLVGDQQALLVTRDGRAEGLVTRADLLEALAS